MRRCASLHVLQHQILLCFSSSAASCQPHAYASPPYSMTRLPPQDRSPSYAWLQSTRCRSQRGHVCRLFSCLVDRYRANSKSKNLAEAARYLSQDLVSNGDQSFALVCFQVLAWCVLQVRCKRRCGKLDLRSCAVRIDEHLVSDPSYDGFLIRLWWRKIGWRCISLVDVAKCRLGDLR